MEQTWQHSWCWFELIIYLDPDSDPGIKKVVLSGYENFKNFLKALKLAFNKPLKLFNNLKKLKTCLLITMFNNIRKLFVSN